MLPMYVATYMYICKYIHTVYTYVRTYVCTHIVHTQNHHTATYLYMYILQILKLTSCTLYPLMQLLSQVTGGFQLTLILVSDSGSTTTVLGALGTRNGNKRFQSSYVCMDVHVSTNNTCNKDGKVFRDMSA